MKYDLIKEHDGEFGFKDQDGVSFDTPQQWFFTGILGGCGCGSSEELSEKAFQLLEYFGLEHDKRNRDVVNPYDGNFWELMAHWFDSKGLIEHGSGIGSSWLTEDGENVLKILKGLS